MQTFDDSFFKSRKERREAFKRANVARAPWHTRPLEFSCPADSVLHARTNFYIKEHRFLVVYLAVKPKIIAGVAVYKRLRPDAVVAMQ